MMGVSVSIIVPMYNVENYLCECIDSLLNQTLSNIEVILVDDGSPDNCGTIADEYALEDNRVKVIHQENQGLGPARNTGMKLATGEYIGFVDSDDFVKPTMFEKLYAAARDNECDIVTGGSTKVSQKKVVKVMHPLAGKLFTQSSEILNLRKKFYGHLESLDGSVYLPVSSWRSIYKRELIEDHKLAFREILSEDIFFDLDIYAVAKSILFIDAVDYCYRNQGQFSITRTFSENKLIRYRDLLSNLMQKALEECDNECVLRVKSQAIDRCRGYARLVNRSGDTIKNKKRYLRNFAEDSVIKKCWEGFPLKYLPIKQRIFHWLILKKLYGCALLLAKIA